MSTEQGQDGRAPGSVPNAFGNALAWKWAPAMPTKVRRSILTLLYALRAMANANGELRFHGDHKPIRIQDIARAAGADEKDCRRYMRAAIAAGLVSVKGEQKRGKPTLYTLELSPWPDWDAAQDALQTSRRKPGKAAAPWKDDGESSGDRDPNQFGGPRPELTDGTEKEVRGTAPPTSSGDRDPIGSGDRDPNNPGIAMELPQGMAEVGEQPQESCGDLVQNDHHSPGQDHHDTDPAADTEPQPPPTGYTRCACGIPLIPRPGRAPRAHCHACETQERTA